MIYSIDGNSMLFEIDRTKIIDISVGDTIDVKGFPGAVYNWTNHDSEFIENNPDNDIFLEIQRVAENKFKAVRIIV
ncbi:MAG: hypothetical protein ACOYXT_28085 [Bacteroidota bacterium]